MKYKYKAMKKDGTVDVGILEASDTQAVVELIRGRGMMPLSIDGGLHKAKSDAPKKDSRGSFFNSLKLIGTVPLKDKAVFFRQLATMIKAGVSLGSSMEILLEQTKNRIFKNAITAVKKNIDGGFSLSSAMAPHSVFPPMSIPIIQAGEEGGNLDASLERVADFLESQDALRKKIVSALTYPAAVMIFSMVVLYILITVVMPKFAKVFSGLGIELPFATRMMFAFGMWMAEHWVLFISTVAVIVGTLVFLSRWEGTKPYMDRVKLKVPVFGNLGFKAGMTRSTRTLASLVHSGITILNALDMASRVSGNSVFEDAFKSLEQAARKGIGLGDAAKSLNIFPPMVSHMLRVGEETGQIDDMLNKVADWYELELDEMIKRLTSILEPLLIVFVGGVVAIVAMAIFSPIVTAIQEMM